MSIVSILVNYVFTRGDKRRDAGLYAPTDIKRQDGIAYDTKDKCQLLDLYRPLSEEGKKLPVIVSVHGGGWVYGDKELYQYYCMSLSQRGFAVVNFTYRVAPKAKFMAIMEDVSSVFRWVLENAEKYGMDTENIFAVGDSAGAHLLGVYSALCTNPSYAARFAFDAPAGFAPKAIALNCGIYDINWAMETNRIVRTLVRDLLPKKDKANQMQLVNFLPYVTESFPPCYIMSANADQAVDYAQARKLKEKLKKVKVSFVEKVYGNAARPLNHVFHCNVKTSAAKACNDDECGYFKSLI